MAIKTTHTIEVKKMDDPTKYYTFELGCSCQWQALASTAERAKMYLESHKAAQGLYLGNAVVVLGEALLMGNAAPAPVEAAKVEDAE